MKTINFIIFFSIVLTIYGSVNYYIFIRGWQAIPPNTSMKTCYLIVFLVLALSFIFGRILENFWLSPVSDALVWVGSFWLSAILYFLMIIIALDFLRLVNHFLPFFPSLVVSHYDKAKFITALAAIGIVVLTAVFGYANAIRPTIKTLELSVDKHVDGPKRLNIVAASDIHLGTIVGKSRLNRLVNQVNALKPDIVFLPGDVFDEDLKPVIRHDLGDTLRKIQAPLGVFAITGNHEYIGGVEEACKYLGEHGILVLRDSVLKIKDILYIVGREDRDISRFTDKKRKSLDELMRNVDKSCPVILLDHQPFDLEQTAAAGVDLQISGHTHNGQLWPLNYITEKVYELSWGYKKIGATSFYVSSGFGTWGPPVRTGSRPEIVNIRLTFQ
jgi:predicted MPP superfamily phosphohydrolase